jgi:hypothetical protein
MNMLTSFFVRFTANITSSELEELKKIAKRIEKVQVERKERRRDSYLLIGKHWIVIAIYEERLEMEMHQILLPCNPEFDKVCIDESLTNEIASETDWFYMFEDCKDIDIAEVRYSTEANNVWILFKCIEQSYNALFNITIDPQHYEELDPLILQLIAKYFNNLNISEFPAMIRPM